MLGGKLVTFAFDVGEKVIIRENNFTGIIVGLVYTLERECFYKVESAGRTLDFPSRLFVEAQLKGTD